MSDTHDEIPLRLPLVAVTGRLICQSESQMKLAHDLLPDHIDLSRAEPGNLRFDLTPDEPSLTWSLNELFADDAAFNAHQSWTRESRWGLDSGDLLRDFTRTNALPRMREETPADHQAISELLTRAFGGPDEAQLVSQLRRDGDLTLSLLAEVQDTIIAHLALSPVSATRPALALAPLAVHPAVQSRGIGDALTRAALQRFANHTIIVLGDPGYYTRFGFAPADLDSPYAGPHLMATGPDLPAGSRITHAPAFQSLE